MYSRKVWDLRLVHSLLYKSAQALDIVQDINGTSLNSEHPGTYTEDRTRPRIVCHAITIASHAWVLRSCEEYEGTELGQKSQLGGTGKYLQILKMSS
jgi:hypothetical protein